MTTKRISTIVDDAVARACECMSKEQAIGEGCLLGAAMAEWEINPDHRKELKARLRNALSETAYGSYAWEFIDSTLYALVLRWARS